MALAIVCAATLARADIDGDRFRSDEWRVSLMAPKSWQLTEQTSYPNILLWMVRQNPDGKMLLAAEQLDRELDARDYADRTIEVLEELGFSTRAPQVHSSTGAYWIEMDNGTSFLRQAFMVADGVGYTLTLSASDRRTRSQHLRAFDYVLRSISLDRKASGG